MAIRLLNFTTNRFHKHLLAFSLRPTSTFNQESFRKMSTCDGPGLLSIFKASPKRLERIRFLGQLYEANGHELRIAGGAVRDILRGKSPVDIDFATTALPEKSLEILRKYQDIVRIIVTAAGQKHGTVAVKFKEAEIDFKRIKLSQEDANNGPASSELPLIKPEYDDESPYEITTLRCDKFTDGRHAEVEFIEDWRKDAERRDLTINAMFLTLNEGKLIDYFNGEEDLKNGVVKFVGEADLRIKEDYLRILRYFRFWSRYGIRNQPDPDTAEKLTNNLPGLNIISGERIWQEIKKTLGHLPCDQVMELLLKFKVFEYAGLRDKGLNDYDGYCRDVIDEIKSIQDNIMKYLDSVAAQKVPELLDSKKMKDLIPVIIFASCVRTEELCSGACEKLKFSNLERDIILFMIANRKIKNDELTIEAFKRQLAICHPPERAQHSQRIKAYLIARGMIDFVQELMSWEIPTFPLTGRVVANAVRKRKLSSKIIKDIIESLKLHWANHGYSLTAEELEQKMNMILSEMAVAPSSPSQTTPPPPSPTTNHQIIKQLMGINCIMHGQFTLKSGQTSSIYVNLREISMHPDTFNQIVGSVAGIIEQKMAERSRNQDQTPVAIVGVPYGVLLLAGAVVDRCKLAGYFVRKEAKAYGAQPDPNAHNDHHFILIEDVMSTGSSIIETIQKLEGKKVTDVIVVVDRESGGVENLRAHYPDIQVHSVIKLKQILEFIDNH